MTPEGVEVLMDLWPLAEAFERLYLAPSLLLDSEKKRLTARCRWHFGGGPDYCSTCARECDACPYREHEPLTLEGWETWDVVLRCASQLRLTPGAAIGLDLGAGLTIDAALDYDGTALAELLPAAEDGTLVEFDQLLFVVKPA